MNTKQEYKILRNILKCVNDSDKVSSQHRLVGYILIFVPLIVVILISVVFGVKNEFAKMLLMCLVGGSLGLSIQYLSSSRLMPIIAKYLNKNEIENRLSEINQNNGKAEPESVPGATD